MNRHGAERWKPPRDRQRRSARVHVVAVAALLTLTSTSARSLLAQAPATPAIDTGATYEFRIERNWLTMRDGVRLAVTYFLPIARHPGERFPVLLELIPYRKDDSFYLRDYPPYAYFARRGFLMAKVDVRGTGSSEGRLPAREYSSEELADAEEIIAALARRADANGRVGMWGISWGGFNALQTAMRRPPALRAILVLHGSDDLYADDIHYIDGVLHVDPYALEIDHENGLPRPPDYALDSAYFADRFDTEPWIFTYLRHSTDGAWWRAGSLRFQYETLNVPAYFVGGLLDGYRDTPIRALDAARVPVQVEMGPWQHDWPDQGVPGPNYEWRAHAAAWWRRWLQDSAAAPLSHDRLLVFVRRSHPPDPKLATTPGSWRLAAWPVPESGRLTIYPSRGKRLADAPAVAAAGEDSLHLVPHAGTAAGDWWGDPTGDMRADDGYSLVYDTEPLSASQTIVGMPRAMLRVRAAAERAHWTVRLEDVAPDGRVSLVTGALFNGAMRESRTAPTPVAPGEWFDAQVTLHFTTWTFPSGHRIRLAIANAQFPMAWPSPTRFVSGLRVGDARTRLELPVVPEDFGRPAELAPPAPREVRPDAGAIDVPHEPMRRWSDPGTGMRYVELESRYGFALPHARLLVRERNRYAVHPRDPSRASYLGRESHDIEQRGRRVRLETTIDVTSTRDSLRVRVERRLIENGAEVRRRTWRDTIPRVIH